MQERNAFSIALFQEEIGHRKHDNRSDNRANQHEQYDFALHSDFLGFVSPITSRVPHIALRDQRNYKVALTRLAFFRAASEIRRPLWKLSAYTHKLEMPEFR